MCQLYVYDGNLLVHWNMSRTLRNNKLVNRTFVKTATIILFFFLFYWPKISFPAKIIKEDKARQKTTQYDQWQVADLRFGYKGEWAFTIFLLFLNDLYFFTIQFFTD